MSLFGQKEKQQIAQLELQLSEVLKANARLLTPELQNHEEVQRRVHEATEKLANLESEIKAEAERLADSKRKRAEVQRQIIEADDEILVQSFGLYKPRYSFKNAEKYKQKLEEIRKKQKQLIKDKKAVMGVTSWSVNGSNAEGKKMVSDTQKLLLRAFNLECDALIDKVRFNNIEMSERRIESSRDAISKLGRTMNISITTEYYRSKLEELYLSYEYQVKKQEEKEEQQALRARMREEAKLEKELEEARRKIEKEQTHYAHALEAIRAQISTASDSEALEALRQKETDTLEKINSLDAALKDVDYREANQRAGYVYIISNIGAFGENVYKIGMTRRLDPMERIAELGDASVPFNFDVHAMIFSEDAPKLEAALHNAFANQKLNFVNQRREFFRAPLSDIKAVIQKNFDKTVEYVDVPPAQQYRESLLMRKQAGV